MRATIQINEMGSWRNVATFIVAERTESLIPVAKAVGKLALALDPHTPGRKALGWRIRWDDTGDICFDSNELRQPNSLIP